MWFCSGMLKCGGLGGVSMRVRTGNGRRIALFIGLEGIETILPFRRLVFELDRAMIILVCWGDIAPGAEGSFCPGDIDMGVLEGLRM